MRWTLAAMLGSAMLAHQALAKLTFSVTATRNGVPIPESDIHLEPFEFGRSRLGHAKQVQPNQMMRRANPTANSANWCGSVNTTPSNNQIKVIHGLYRHPACSIRTGVTTYPQAAAAWVGIDGDSWSSALLQSGTVCKIDNSTGIVKHEAWWQWVPEAAYTITSMPVDADDWMQVTIDTASTTSAKITITNLSKALSYVINVNSGPTLGRVNADWVVERPYYGASLVSFADFTDVWFDDAWASRVAGPNFGILGAKQYQIPGLCASQEWDDASQVSWSL